MSAGEITADQKARIQTLAGALKVADKKTTDPTPAPALDKRSYEFLSVEPKEHYEYQDLKSLADKLPKDHVSIMLRLDDAKTLDILTPDQTYKNRANKATDKEGYSVNSNSPASRIIFYTPNDAKKKETGKLPYVILFFHYDLSTTTEMKLDDEKQMSGEQIEQIALAHSQIHAKDKNQKVFMYGNPSLKKQAGYMLFLFLVLDDFETLFVSPYSQGLERMYAINEQLKRQGIILDLPQRTKLLEGACLIHQREAQILAEEKERARKEEEEEKAKQKEKSQSPSQSKKSSDQTDWAKKIIEGLWKYRILLAFILTLIVLLVFATLFWPALVGFAFTVTEMASAVLAAKIATLFIMAFLGLCLMSYLKHLQPQPNFAEIDRELGSVVGSKRRSSAESLNVHTAILHPGLRSENDVTLTPTSTATLEAR